MKRISSLVLLVIIATCLSIVTYLYWSRPRIAYVKTLDLVYGYNGMKEAHITYKNQAQQLQTNLDSLKIQYQREISDYKLTEKSLSDEARKQKQNVIRSLEDNVNKYAQQAHQQVQENEKEMTESILNQVNGFVEEYAKKEGYDLVLGAGGNGTVMYGSNTYDITQEVLDAINKNYRLLPNKN